MYSKLTIIGRVGRDPESRFTPQGQQVTNFSVATSNKYTGKNGLVEETTWYRVQVWGKMAEVCNTYVAKGMLVMVEGRLVPDKETGSPQIYTNKQGKASASFDVNAQTVKFLSKVEREDRDDGSEEYGEPVGIGGDHTDESEFPF